MIRLFMITMIALFSFAVVAPAIAMEDSVKTEMIKDATDEPPQIGAPAPHFVATDTHGNEVSLEGLKGQNVVLEWTNHQCPFVIKHYETGNMQSLQDKAKELGVTWISIVSSADGKEGNTTPEEANAIMGEQNTNPTHRILDPEGTIGHLYRAKTTPHLFVIDAEGILRYQGAIDDNPSPRQSAVETARNYVLEAMVALTEGTEIEVTQTRSYGCSVKY